MSNLNLWQLKVSKWKESGYKIVFTNGCFDLFHFGHLQLIKGAASFGDKLIIGINSNTSVRRLKGQERPIIDERERLGILSAIRYVDLVIPFDDDTPYDLIAQIKPDVLIKGSDYDIKDIVGSEIVLENGGTVETLPLVEGKSTSNLIKQIRTMKSE